jgi:hypothetical protein
MFVTYDDLIVVEGQGEPVDYAGEQGDRYKCWSLNCVLKSRCRCHVMIVCFSIDRLNAYGDNIFCYPQTRSTS